MTEYGLNMEKYGKYGLNMEIHIQYVFGKVYYAVKMIEYGKIWKSIFKII